MDGIFVYLHAILASRGICHFLVGGCVRGRHGVRIALQLTTVNTCGNLAEASLLNMTE